MKTEGNDRGRRMAYRREERLEDLRSLKKPHKRPSLMKEIITTVF
jgi:hypothetical protein